MMSSVLLREPLWSVPFWAALGVAIMAGASDVSHAAERPTGTAILQQLRSFATHGQRTLRRRPSRRREHAGSSPTWRAGAGTARPISRSPAATADRTCSAPSSARARAWPARRSCSPPAGSTAGDSSSPARTTSASRRTTAETLQIWDRQAVLADIVRVIRDLPARRDHHPVFARSRAATHGHHTASAVLAVEAFKLAGDPKAFPEQLRELDPWQPTASSTTAAWAAAAVQARVQRLARVPDGPAC